MSDTPNAATYSSLGERDCWPVTGPIYGLIAAEEPARPAKGSAWRWWLLRQVDDDGQIAAGPVSPIHY